jgi:hypothetical protein
MGIPSTVNPPKITTCPYCGKTAEHELIHREDYTVDIEASPDGYSDQEERWLAILKCTQCGRPSIYRDEWDQEKEKWGAVLVYPVPTHAPGEVPTKIRSIFDTAIGALPGSPSLAAVGIRKSLEGICDDKKAQGDTLTERIAYLGANGFIPQPLAEMMESSPTIGKIGSHFGNMDISRQEVDVLIEYTLAVFECLYIVQARIDAVRERLQLEE